MKAVLIGGTGAVGNDLLHQLLEDNRFSKVLSLGRRPSGLTHPKLEEQVIDFDHPDAWTSLVQGDVLFSCLGTTLRQAGGQKQQWKVDYTYQLEVAKTAAQNGVGVYVLVSSIGAKSSSRNFYLRMKGSLEDAAKQLPFRSVVFIRPQSLIRKNSDRIGERIGVVLCKIFCAITPWHAWKPIKTEDVASEMIIRATNPYPGVQVVYGTDITRK